MRKEDAKIAIVDFLGDSNASQAVDISKAVGIHKSTIMVYLKSMEPIVVKTRVGRNVYWSIKPVSISPSLVICKHWTEDLFRVNT